MLCPRLGVFVNSFLQDGVLLQPSSSPAEVCSVTTFLVQALVTGADPAQIGAFLVLLRAKGETAEEIAGMARAMRALSVPVETPYDGGWPVSPAADRALLPVLLPAQECRLFREWSRRKRATRVGSGRHLLSCSLPRGCSAVIVGAWLACDTARALSPPAVLDIVGTGGDGIGSVNISTGATVIAAAAGAKVAKHGNRSGEQWGCRAGA